MAAVPSNASFLASYPEFNSIGASQATLITVKLTEAARRTNANVFQSTDLAADAVCMRAAILLLASPFGMMMRSEDPEAVFALEWKLRGLQRSATIGLRVPGSW